MKELQPGDIEKQLLASNITTLVGVDEVGRGCLAGPTYAGAAILDYDAFFSSPKKERGLLRDSKTLSSKQRLWVVEKLNSKWTTSWGIGSADVREVETLGIVRAIFLAMERALAAIPKFDMLLIDGKMPLPSFKGPQRAVIRGDSLCLCIAAASILAKEARDDAMRGWAKVYPEYGFERHVGYGTQAHLNALALKGPCQLHRRNFEPIKHMSLDDMKNLV